MQIRRMAIAIIGDCFPSLSSRRGRRTTHPTCSGSTTNIVRRANPGHLLHALEELDDRKAETDQRDGSPHPRHHRAFECVSRARRVRSQAKWRSPVTRTSNLPALGAVRASAIPGAFFADVPHTLSTAIFWALYEGTIRFFIRPRGVGAVQLQAGALAAPPRSAAASHISLGSKVSAANMVRITTASRQQASRPWPAPKYDEEKGDLAP